MDTKKIRNIAIIAHVDHGKTTLVDQLFRHSGVFRKNQVVRERVMDSIDQERERGITITSKNGSFLYKDHRVNIIDTPGHADFGGQVERILKMADGALLLVDAAEGPMPQTRFVLSKAIALSLPVIVVINKMDKPAARCHWVLDQVFDLMVYLNAPDYILDFPVIYASAKDGYARYEPSDNNHNLIPLCDTIIKNIPAPKVDIKAPFQMLVSSIQYSPHRGRMAIGKINAGTINVNQEVLIVKESQEPRKSRIVNIYHFEGNKQKEVKEASPGDIISIAGIEDINIGETITDPALTTPLPGISIDPPTISMHFIANDSPFSGNEGIYVTSSHLIDRLRRETLSDVALIVEDLPQGRGCRVDGRGELHLSVLIEKMRREGYEFQVTTPHVIFKEKNGQRLEPYEELTLDMPEESTGRVMESMGTRKAHMITMDTENAITRLVYKISTRGLLGYKSDFLTETKGLGTMNYIFMDFDKYAGEIRYRQKGVLISGAACTTSAYALDNLQSRGRLFIGPVIKVYGGQIIGESARDEDMVVNPAKGKKLSNMRAAGSDEAILLIPPLEMSLEQYLAFINDDELVEVTPKSIRLRKIVLDETERKRQKKIVSSLNQ
jgi:GTP-binding protein